MEKRVELLIFMLVISAILRTSFLEKIYTIEASEFKLKEVGYETPEETAQAYMNALENKDIEQMINLFAIETYVQRCDIRSWIELGTYSCYSSPLPMNDNIFTKNLNIMMRQKEVFKYLRYFYANISSAFTGTDFNVDEGESGKDILDQFWLIKDEKDIFDIKMEGFGNLQEIYEEQNNSSTSYYDVIKNSVQRTKKYLGCDDIIPIVVKCRWKNIPIYLFMDMVKYENKWLILNLGGIGTTILGFVSTQVIVPQCVFENEESQEIFTENLTTILNEIIQKESQEESVPEEIKCEGYETPEEAIGVFFDCMKQNDINNMTGSMNLEMLCQKFDVSQQIETIGNYYFCFMSKIPFSGQCANILNREYMKFGYGIQEIYLALVGEGLDDENKERVSDCEKYMNCMKGKDCSGLRYGDITELSENTQYYTKVLRADQVKCFSVNLELGNSSVDAKVICLCSNGKWVVSNLSQQNE